MRIVALHAGLGQPSSSRMLVDRTIAAARRSSDEPIEVEIVELRDLGHDLVNHLATRVPSPALRAALDAVEQADALIAVTPVFNASYAGLFKIFFDVLDEGSLRGRPVLLGATGGTARHSLAIDQAMVPMFFYLKANVVPTTVFAATDNWGSDAGLEGRIDRAAAELVAMTRQTTGVQRPARKASDDFALTEDFASMMARLQG